MVIGLWEAACSDLLPDVPSVLLDRRDFVGEEITHLSYGKKIEAETEESDRNRDGRREKIEIEVRPHCACV